MNAAFAFGGRQELRWAAAALLACLAIALPAHAAGTQQATVEAGRQLYVAGQLPGGRLLSAKRLADMSVSGAQAACVNCHRPSGMGGVEGDIQVPPITGNALFGTGDRVIATMDPRSGKAFNRAHEPYTEADVGRMLREGQRPDGTILSPLMPRYELAEAELGALNAYLHQLSSDWSPGVSADTIRFATVVTPDVPAGRRAIFLDMVRKMVAQKNGSTKVAGPATRHHMTSAAELVLGTERRWTLDVWELQGEPATWAAQLDAHYAQQPVFALLSGLGGADWGPIDAFCDRHSLPCWFPSVALAPSEAPGYSLYFTGGTRQEARVLASDLRAEGAQLPRHLLQVHRADAAGLGGARALAAALAGSSVEVQDLLLPAGNVAPLATALQALGPHDAVMFWLGSEELSRLAALPPPRATSYFSGQLGGAEHLPLPAGWQASAHLVDLYELPERRAANLAYFKSWLNQRHVPLVDEAMQSEVYFSVAFMTDTIAEMLGNLHRDYLIERAETMIRRREGGRAEAEYYSSTQSHIRTQSQAPAAEAVVEPVALRALRLAGTAFGVREGTTAYPRLSLGAGQRFASRGGYITHLDASGKLLADGEWIVP